MTRKRNRRSPSFQKLGKEGRREFLLLSTLFQGSRWLQKEPVAVWGGSNARCKHQQEKPRCFQSGTERQGMIREGAQLPSNSV